MGTVLRTLQTPLCKPPFFLYRFAVCCQNSYLKDTETHEEEATTVFKTVGMPSWYAWPARSCITVAFALRKAKELSSLQLLFLDEAVWPLLQVLLSTEYAFPLHSLFPWAFLSNEIIRLHQKGMKENATVIPFAT